MNDWMPQDGTDLSTTFDTDFGENNLNNSNWHEVIPFVDFSGDGDFGLNQDVLNYQDPLRYSHKYQFQPLELDLGNTHVVEPHQVDGYMRKNGTYVESYYRDGDGNPETNLTSEQGGGYLRSNPDGNPFNNLKG